MDPYFFSYPSYAPFWSYVPFKLEMCPKYTDVPTLGKQLAYF